MTYEQAVNLQKFDSCAVILIERMPDKYVLTRVDGLKVSTTLEFGIKHWPIVLCGRNS